MMFCVLYIYIYICFNLIYFFIDINVLMNNIKIFNDLQITSFLLILCHNVSVFVKSSKLYFQTEIKSVFNVISGTVPKTGRILQGVLVTLPF